MAAVTVTTTAARVDSDTSYTTRIECRVVGATTVYALTASGAAADGLPLYTDDTYTDDLAPDDELWLVTASGTSEVRVIERQIR